MKIRSKAPLRLGLAGGGTDVSPYSDVYGGCVLNTTINLYAHTFIDSESDNSKVIFIAQDLNISEKLDINETIDLDGPLILHRAVYNKVIERFNNGVKIPILVNTRSDVPPGSGLGSSSTMVVAMLEAYRKLLSLPLGEYELASLAYEIERVDCGLSGGKQDQYAATFGGFNFIEFYENDRVIVNPLRIRYSIKSELEASLVLFFSGVSRSSSDIIEDQMKSLDQDKKNRLAAMHEVKALSYKIKELLFKGDFDGLMDTFRKSWVSKKETSSSITNSSIDQIERGLLENGARALKVSGAGGGGFLMIFVDPERKQSILDGLKELKGSVHNFQFTNEGVFSWTI